MEGDSKVIVLRGGGRHGAVVYETVKENNPLTPILLWDDGNTVHPSLSHLERFQPGNENLLKDAANILCYVAVGSSKLRLKLVESVKTELNVHYNVKFPNIFHKTAVISSSAKLGFGNYFGPFSLVNTCAEIGDFCLVNSAVLIEHDCSIGNFVTLNPSCVLLGSVKVESFSTIGAGAVVRDDCAVSCGTLIGMCAAVVKSIDEERDCFWGGIPAKPILLSPLRAIRNLESVEVDKSWLRWCVKKSYSSQRIHAYLEPSLRTGHLTNDGPLQSVVIAKFKSLVKCNGIVIMASSGTGALHALAAGLSLKEGKMLRWVTQAFTFPSSIQGPLSESVVCDIDTKYFGPSFEYLNQNKDRFDGVIVTNVFGLQSEIVAYEKWCSQEGKLLIFDNAASPIGFLEDGRCIHDVGDGAMVSLHETKPFGRGEGGVVVCRPEVSPFVHQAMNFGFDIPAQIRVPNRFSSNWRMSDIAAAAICDHFDVIAESKWIEKFREMTEFVVEKLEENNLHLALKIRYPTILSCLFVKLRPGMDGDTLYRQLNALGIEAKHYYTPLVSKLEAPNAWSLYENTVCLPFHLDMSKTDLIKIVKKI